MRSRHIKLVAFVLALILFSAHICFAQQDANEKHILVAMRMIGHQILLQSGDSSSLVLPVEKDSVRYKIQFANEFQISPEMLVATIDSVVKQAGLGSSYIVEVKECSSLKVVYSYEMGKSVKNDLVPCINRMLPKACYQIHFSILEPNHSLDSFFTKTAEPINKAYSETKGVHNFIVLLIFIALLVPVSLLYYQKKKRKTESNPNIIRVGAYQFNRRTMELSFKNEAIELSSKEADLLSILLKSSNRTVERDYMLKTVWGDEGSYIGRTLDVFISKLRKKLEGDTNVKIVNVRGVGYKLVLKG